jgi:hypothetical protein
MVGWMGHNPNRIHTAQGPDRRCRPYADARPDQLSHRHGPQRRQTDSIREQHRRCGSDRPTTTPGSRRPRQSPPAAAPPPTAAPSSAPEPPRRVYDASLPTCSEQRRPRHTGTRRSIAAASHTDSPDSLSARMHCHGHLDQA